MTPATIPGWQSMPQWLAVRTQVHQDEAAAVQVATGSQYVAGHCALCGHADGFRNAPATSLREGMACTHCGCNARQRAAALVLFEALEHPHMARVYLTEQASPFYLALRRRLGRLIGSEFMLGLRHRLRMSMWLWRRGALAWIRLEDVTALRFGDARMDGIVTQDVLEHVPDYTAALREFARVLKPGGVLVMTVPFYDNQADNVQIARPDGRGGIEHVGAPEFHGDPRGGGVVCFHHFGWALLASMREAGFNDVVACRVQDAARGLPQGQWVLRALR